MTKDLSNSAKDLKEASTSLASAMITSSEQVTSCESNNLDKSNTETINHYNLNEVLLHLSFNHQTKSTDCVYRDYEYVNHERINFYENIYNTRGIVNFRENSEGFSRAVFLEVPTIVITIFKTEVEITFIMVVKVR